ncbi:hypothetical protein M2352_005254 [Azospirillum fermentarium]|nr:hypothetical protein [Azospirillum fermentarium]
MTAEPQGTPQVCAKEASGTQHQSALSLRSGTGAGEGGGGDQRTPSTPPFSTSSRK